MSLELSFAVLLAVAAAAAPAARPDPHAEEVARLSGEIAALDADPALAELGAVARLKARQAIADAAAARRRDRAHALYLAGLRVATARAAAEADLLAEQARQLDDERDQIMVEASRLEAERARREAERLRLRALAREEAAEREMRQREEAQTLALQSAAAEAEQARRLAEARAAEAALARREAELAAALAADAGNASPPPVRREGGREIYTLAGDAFPSGSSQLTAVGQASLRALAAQLAGGSGRISIEGHTDSQGADDANLRLSKLRAEAVRRVLEDAGVDASRLSASGHGEARPVADNGSAAGRARNRRVEIILD
ncbi:hypothetical protein P873_07665 [Arenimonas composti TR7-09 = DSM 18010]|uniref:OmpA-like domain-containing protein n=2 Tax=Arenimonas TaxID=490567 RepID=A0A091BEQ5_9GAMM|nr:OmpA family protein [Arenimonas composti]KFN50226.1 hypothetical protein P873_07665 [Arenimonas composti TR7-09 = DSM 18010]